MSDVVWLPSLLVLGIGLVLGLLAALAVRRSRRRKGGKSTEELRLRDLEARRDDLYRRLRSPDLSSGDRESLELAAAHTLRELDRLAPAGAKREKRTKERERPPAAETAAAAEAAPPRAGMRHPALVGFVAGMAVVVLVGTLVYLAVRDSGAARAPETTAGSPDEPHAEDGSLPAEVRRELERLEAAAAAAPNDLLARKRLALGRLDAGLFFESFKDAEAILAERPEDPDGLFIQGVVRLSMGDAAAALDRLDRVLARYPEHLQAMIYRGLALARTGDMDQATGTWEMALEMAGGSHPDLEMLLQQAYASQEQAASQPAAPPPAPTPAPPPPVEPAAPAAAPPPAAAPGDADSYRVTVELAAGSSAPPAAVLFVFLRPGETGPPVAVKRIPAPRFPVQLSLGAADAMMGGAQLPAQGNLVARLSASGSVSGGGPGDLEASSAAEIGQSTRLVLDGS